MTDGRARSGHGSYLLDTHVWLWHVLGSKELPSGLRRAMDSAATLFLSPVSIWELGLLVERGRFRTEGSFRDWVAGARERLPVVEAPLNWDVALMSSEVDLPHRDPADRFLAATALVYELTLLTVDRRLTSARWLPTRSR